MPCAYSLWSERHQRPRDLVVPLLLLQLGQLVVGAHYWLLGLLQWRLCVLVLVFSCLWWSWLKNGFSLFKVVSWDFLCWRRCCLESSPYMWWKKVVSALDNCKSNQIEHIFMNTKIDRLNPDCDKQKKPSYESPSQIRKTWTAGCALASRE